MIVRNIVALSIVSLMVILGVTIGLGVFSFTQPRDQMRPITATPPLTKLLARVDVAPAVTPAAPPIELRIPSLNIIAEIEHVGLDEKNNMDVPHDHRNVAWYQHGAVPGQQGNAVIAGHLDSETGPAVFYNLASLTAGQEITVAHADGTTHTFVFTGKERYAAADFPIDRVFGSTTAKRLNLITCDGSFDRANLSYSHRTVVFAELAE